MLVALKMTMLKQGKRQTRMAVDLGWDPAKLSRIVNEITIPTAEDRSAIASYLKVAEDDLFGGVRPAPRQKLGATQAVQRVA